MDYEYEGSSDDWISGSGFMGDPLTPYTPSEDIYGPDLSPAYGALRDMPVEQQQYLLNQFFETEAGQQLSPEERRALENEVYSGLTSDQMRELSKQAEQDTEKGGIMSGNPFGTQSGGTKGQSFLDKLLSNKGLLQAGLGGLGALAAYKSAKDAQKQAAGAKFESRGPVTATRSAFKGTKYSAAGGGIGSLDMAQGGRALPPRYLDGHSDGMADKVPANIDGRRPAALSDGEFVIPADVVSHLGNGNSNAGAKRLYKMMDDIRAARTGNPKQGKQINPDKFMPR
jgi:hypothetical protein